MPGVRSPIMRTYRGIVATAAAVTALALTGAAPGDDAVRRHQAALLDPQAREGTATTTSHHDHHQPGVEPGPLPELQGGRWERLPGFEAFNSAHAVAGPHGVTLLIAGSGNSRGDFAAGRFQTMLIRADGSRAMIPTPADLFCAGHILLPSKPGEDVRALVVGGTAQYDPVFHGLRTKYAFNFTTEAYEPLTPMEVARWYPTLTRMWDGRTVIVGGLDDAGWNTPVVEVADRAGGTSRVPGERSWPLYPDISQGPDGRLFYSGVGLSVDGSVQPGLWSPFAQTFTPVPGLPDADRRGAAAACYTGDVRDFRRLVVGGGWPATASTAWVDLDAAHPAYHPGPDLPAAKSYAQCVNLPDGTVLQVGGGTSNTVAGAVREGSTLAGVDGAWHPVNPLPDGEHRLYHSMLILRDSGCLLSTTSNPDDDRSYSVLQFCPPYALDRNRPVLTSAPDWMGYGGTYRVAARSPVGARLVSVSLVAATSPTHSTDPNQRFAALPVVNGRIKLPVWRSAFPPGWYRLWARDTAGRVSPGRWVSVG
jgi:hypothetical protein